MYKIGEFVVYGNEGVCEVGDISEINIPGINENKKYYTLKPMHENGTVFAPVDTNVFMRPVMTYKEVQELIEQIPSIKEIEDDTMNAKLLQEHYKKLLKTHKCIDSLTVMVSLNDKKSELIKSGKKLGQIEDKFMKIATSLIEDEFSIVLGIPKKEVEVYINDKIKDTI